MNLDLPYFIIANSTGRHNNKNDGLFIKNETTVDKDALRS
mgnify:CR=1 FL=1